MTVTTGEIIRPDTGGRVRSRLVLVGTACGLAAPFVLVLAAVASRGHVLPWQPHLLDLEVYRAGGHAVLTSAPLYGALAGTPLPFTYPPAAAVLFVPLSVLPPVLAQLLVLVLDSAVVAGLWLTLASVTRLPVLRAAAATPARLATLTVLTCGLVEPVRATLDFGQVNLALMALVLLDALVVPRGHRWRGAATGLAAAIKLTPALFVVLLLVTGQRRAFRTALATSGGVTLAGLVLLPRESVKFWFGYVLDTGRAGSPGYLSNQSIVGAVTRLAGPGVTPLGIGVLLSVAVAGLAMLVARRWHRLGQPLLAVGLCAIGTLLASPITWTHHYVWVLPVVVAAIPLARAAPWLLAVVLAWGAVVATTPFWLLPDSHSVPGYLLGTSPVLLGLAVLAAAAVSGPGRRSAGPGRRSAGGLGSGQRQRVGAAGDQLAHPVGLLVHDQHDRVPVGRYGHRHLQVGHDDHEVADVDEVGGGTVELDRAAAGLAGDRVGLEPGPVG